MLREAENFLKSLKLFRYKLHNSAHDKNQKKKKSPWDN